MRTPIVRTLLLVATSTLAVTACDAREDESLLNLDFKVTDEANAAPTGLPTYPGSKPYKEDEDSNAGADIALSTPLFGFQLAAIHLQTSDSPERVSAFYRKALSKYGSVLECRDGAKTAPRSDDLTCDGNESDRYEVVYKVGSKSRQRVVAIEPLGNGTKFSLVNLDIRGSSKQEH